MTYQPPPKKVQERVDRDLTSINDAFEEIFFKGDPDGIGRYLLCDLMAAFFTYFPHDELVDFGQALLEGAAQDEPGTMGRSAA